MSRLRRLLCAIGIHRKEYAIPCGEDCTLIGVWDCRVCDIMGKDSK